MGTENTEEDEPGRGDVLDEIKARVAELEAEFTQEVEKGTGRITELANDIRTRVETLRGSEPEETPDRVENLKQELDELSAAVEKDIDESRQKLSSILDELNQRVRELERTVRRS